VTAAASLLAAALAAAAVTAWVLRPLRGGAAHRPARPGAPPALAAERDAALALLRDLDADHADGRLGEADWTLLRAEALARAAAAVAALDALAGAGGEGDQGGASGADAGA